MSSLMRQLLMVQNNVPADKMIFADAEVEKVLLANMTHEHEDYITMDEFYALSNISTWFKGNTLITSFNELEQTSVTTLVADSFRGCSQLTAIKFPEGLTSINNNAFYGGPNFEELIFPESLVSIGTWVFTGMHGIKNVILKNDTTLGSCCFYYSFITSMTIYSENPPSASSNFNANGRIDNIYVPASAVDTYKVATTWSNLSSKIQPIQEYTHKGQEGLTRESAQS